MTKDSWVSTMSPNWNICGLAMRKLGKWWDDSVWIIYILISPSVPFLVDLAPEITNFTIFPMNVVWFHYVFKYTIPQGLTTSVKGRWTILYHWNQFVGHVSWAHVLAQNLSGVTAHGASLSNWFFMSWTTQIASKLLKNEWRLRKNYLHLPSGIFLFTKHGWVLTSHNQFQAYWMKISDVSWSWSQAVELTNPSCMSQVTEGAELIQMVILCISVEKSCKGMDNWMV